MTSRPFWSAPARLLGALALVAGLLGCPPPKQECLDGTEDVCDAGGLPPDFCNSAAEALADPTDCLLTVNDATGTTRKTDVYISRLADGGTDHDWYLATMPATVSARSLLHVSAGYSIAQTAVNFSLNLLQQQADGGLTSIGTGVDTHGTSAPKPVDIIVPFSTPGANIFLLVGDQSSGTTPHVDNTSPYSVLVQVIDNPDSNEPNDTTPTVIPLAAGGGGQQGAGSGYLATPNDVDLYSFQVTGAARQIIYLHITGPTPFPTNPPPPYRLSYTLIAPDGTPISEGVMDNQFQSIELATARLAPGPGTYKIKVQGYKDPASSAAVGGDLRVKYDVNVVILPDVDTNEPNDTLAAAKQLNPLPNSTTTLTGKLSYVPDEEWFVLNLPANATTSTIRYKLTAAMGGGRFAPTSGVPTRQLRFFTEVTTGANASIRQVACTDDPVACPKGYTETTSSQGASQSDLVTAICKVQDPPLCLYAERDEEFAFKNLKNLVGAIPIPANKATKLFFMYRDQGRGAVKYADDRDWTLELKWADDPDENGRLGGPTQIALGGSTVDATGQLTYGYGDVLSPPTFDINSGAGIRGPEDYDAFPSDKDLFQFNMSATGDQNWEIAWEVQRGDAGASAPGDLALELTFCGSGAASDAGLCAGEKRLILGDTQSPVAPWYSSSFDLAHSTLLFSRQDTATSTIVTARPIGCWCVNGARVAAGKFFANVAAYDRVSNDPILYTVRQRLTNYPGSYIADGGATVLCPVVDAGCGFAP